MKTKQELRKEILQKRDSLTPEERSEKSKRITERVVVHENFREADVILLFSSYKSEVDTTGIFAVARRDGKEVFYPKVQGKEMDFYKVESERDLIEGYRGIREPEADSGKIFTLLMDKKICVIMPGAVFDEAGNRIGYGGGYYDKFLEKLEVSREGAETTPNVYKIAVAFECQIVEVGLIPNETYDKVVDDVITESRILSKLYR